MTKKIIQDIVSNGSSRKKRDEEDVEEEIGEYDRKERSSWLLGLSITAAGILVLGLFVLLSSYYSYATVSVATTRKSIVLDDLLTLASNPSEGAIKYDFMKFRGEESVAVETTGSRAVEKYSTGIATIYNNYGAAPQKLVAGTRLETKDGKIFRIEKAVTVPGTTLSGGKTVPGTIDVAVKASEPGPAYNIPPSDFTIPGFKGGPRFEKFYAKSIKNMTGGFVGEIRTVSPSDLKSARLRAEESLRQRLTKDAVVQVPKGLILFEDAMFINFTDNAIDDASLAGAEGEPMNLKVTGNLVAVVINGAELENLIRGRKLTDLAPETKVILPDIDKLNLSIVNKDKVNPEAGSSMTAKLTGNLTIVWDFDENALKTKLSGIKKSRYQDTFSDFPVIETAEATFKPSWAVYFPSDINRIEIIKKY